MGRRHLICVFDTVFPDSVWYFSRMIIGARYVD